MRPIDADALMREFAEFVRESNNSDFADVPTWNDAVSLLGSAPTIDAVPVVRCADCIYWEEIECSGYGACNRAMDIQPHGTVYCAFGERKDGDGE